MQIGNDRLIDVLKVIDGELDRKIKLIAVGRTAMTLLGLKTSTVDLDFELIGEDYDLFQEIVSKLPLGYKLDLFKDGEIFTQFLGKQL